MKNFAISLTVVSTLSLGCHHKSTDSLPGVLTPSVPETPTSGPVAPEVLPSSPSIPAAPEIPLTPPESTPERTIKGSIVFLWQQLFPLAHAAETIDVYRFRQTDNYELLGSFKVGSDGSFDIRLDPAQTNDYMLHLILKEDELKWGLREKIVDGNLDQEIKLDAFTAVETRFLKKWVDYSASNLDRDVLLNKKELSSTFYQDILTALDPAYDPKLDWQEFTKSDQLVSMLTNLDDASTEVLGPLFRGEVSEDDAKEKIKTNQSKKNGKTYYTFGDCAVSMDQQKIYEPEGRAEKIELWLTGYAKKPERISFDQIDQSREMLVAVAQKMLEVATATQKPLNLTLTLKDKNSQHEESCQYVVEPL